MKKILFYLAALLTFNCTYAATFTSAASGNWNAPATWTVIGVSATGVPTSVDDVTIAATHTILHNITTTICRDLTINVGGTFTLSGYTKIYGNFLLNGSVTGSTSFYFYGVGCTIDIPLSTYTNGGNWYFLQNSSYTISAATVLSKTNYFYIRTNGSLTNNGSISLNGGSINNAGTYINSTNAYLKIARAFSGSGIWNFTASGNSLVISGNYITNIIALTYYNLIISPTSAHTKSLLGNITVSNDLTLSNFLTLNWANFNITLGGNWINTANITGTNQGTITFNGSGAQAITRASAETFNNAVLSGTGTITSGSNLTCTGNYSLTSGTHDLSVGPYNLNIGGNFTNSGGTFTPGLDTVTFNGAAAQSISTASPITFNTLISNNTSGGVSLTTGSISISNLLSVNSQSFNAMLPQTVTIPATGAITSGRIGPVGAAASLTGTGWIIQSYIAGPTTGGWQYLGSPVAATTLADWDNDAGFWMSGTGGNDGNTSPMFRSVRTVVAPSNITYANVTTQATALTPCKGFMVWMADNNSPSPMLTAPRIFDVKGTPTYGTLNYAVLATGYNLLSNPYACPITFASVVASSSATINSTFVIVNANGTYSNSPNGGVIAASQGFLVWVTAAGNATFSENHKTTIASPNIVRMGNPENYLKIKTSNEINGLGGEATIQINEDAINGEDVYDLPFLSSPYEEATNIWTSDKDNKDLLYNVLNANSDELDIPMSIVAGTTGKQLVTFNGLNSISSYTCANLVDLSTGKKMDLKYQDFYSFDANNVGEKHDFIIHLNRSGDCLLKDQNINESLEALTQAYINDNKIFVKFDFEELSDVNVALFNSMGQQVTNPQNFTVSNQTICLENPGAHGIYFVRIIKGNEVITKKIYL